MKTLARYLATCHIKDLTRGKKIKKKLKKLKKSSKKLKNLEADTWQSSNVVCEDLREGTTLMQ